MENTKKKKHSMRFCNPKNLRKVKKRWWSQQSIESDTLGCFLSKKVSQAHIGACTPNTKLPNRNFSFIWSIFFSIHYANSHQVLLPSLNYGWQGIIWGLKIWNLSRAVFLVSYVGCGSKVIREAVGGGKFLQPRLY